MVNTHEVERSNPGPGWTFFTLYYLIEKTEYKQINEKEAGVGPLKKPQ